MNKRRRTSSAASRQDEEMEMADETTSEQSEQSPVLFATLGGRKRKKLDPSELCQQLYDSIRNLKKEDGSMLCDTFIRAPKRRQEPSYYEVVANPIDLLRVQQKLKTDTYDDIDELTADFELLVNNAKAFYKPSSSEYQDACQLWTFYNANKAKLLETVEDMNEPAKPVRPGRGRPVRKSAAADDDGEGSHAIKEEVLDKYEELFSAIMTATDVTSELNRLLCTEFQLLPSKKLYPDYYDVIEHPIDLKFIATKIQANAYNTLNDLEKDFMQMIKNACLFNEPGSQIYKDAKALKKTFLAKKVEVESGRLRLTKGKRKSVALSAAVASLQDARGNSDDDNEDEMETDGDGPLWQLFDQLYNTANSSDHHNAPGAPLGESLWKLPNRRFYPEYYATIKKPLSMAQIRNKLKKGDYGNITEMTADLYMMIDNAKKAFPVTHKVYKDAAKMQKILNHKLVDGSDNEDSEIEEPDSSTASTIPNTSPAPATASSLQTPLPRKKGRPRLIPGSSTPMTPAAAPLLQTSTPASANQPSASVKRRPQLSLLKKKLTALQQYLTDFTVNGRRPMSLFMEKPSKKLYPDYYEVIARPIDMNTIKANIESDHYSNVKAIVSDYRLMFANCRQYNEENSMIYEDAKTLERALNEKLKVLPAVSGDRRSGGGHVLGKVITKSPRLKETRPLEQKLRQLYETIRDYKEPKGQRHLAFIFMKLPSKNDYPDYYDIIKNPIDLDKIGQKLKSYERVDELASDLMLMFENACKYNEPDSQIYKDALVLQQICVQTKQQINSEDWGDAKVPDVAQAIQELLMSLFTSFYNHEDNEGRCYSDSLSELPEYDETDGTKVRAISLDLIKRRLDKGLYKRLDIFQEDLFACLERARRLSRTDSQVFDDSIELQSFFISTRDKLCKSGEVLQSPALNYTALVLTEAIDTMRQSKAQEEQEQDVDDAATANAATLSQGGESITIDQQVYSTGDFVYYDMPDSKIPGIAYIDRLWTNTENVHMLYGTTFLRPFETYHVATRRFLEKEVFRSDNHQAIPMSKVRGKCYVMNLRDYIKSRPEGFDDVDVYVCDLKYTIRGRFFSKYKTWPFISDVNRVAFVPRDKPVELKRVMSVFKERVEKHKGELAELQEQEALVVKAKPNVPILVNGAEDGNAYFEQYNTICSGVVKMGDFVYVATESGKQSVAQIHSIWETKNGKAFFRGPWILTSSEIPGRPNRSYYQQELLMSSVKATSPIIGVIGRCSVLTYKDYVASRPTEIPEADVYLCESIFDEIKKTIRRVQPHQLLKNVTLSEQVTTDEIYYFQRTIQPARKLSDDVKIKNENDLKIECDGLMDDSLDGGGALSIGSDGIASQSPATPLHGKKKKESKKIVTGYLLYSGEVRKSIVQNNPDCTFGDISRIVGNEWRALSSADKQMWEDKAIRINEENAAKTLENLACASPFMGFPGEPSPNQISDRVYECCWEKCDYQFEDATDCLDHCIAENTGHVITHFVSNSMKEPEYNCRWRGCIRMKKQGPPFPHLQRLTKHVRDVHIVKNNGRSIQPQDRSKNFMPSKKYIPGSQTLSNAANSNMFSAPVMQPLMPPAPPEPLFISVPPRPQRVLHSEAYIRYIEGLQTDSRFIAPWEKTFRATQETIPQVDNAKLPAHWLGARAPEKSDEVINALWQLRNFMMKDVLQIQKNIF